MSSFVPNDILMDEDIDVLLITGPNMAGKSTYMRTLAIIIIMAQNLSSQWEVSVLRMKTNTTILALITWLLWLIQGILLTIFIKSFFTSMQRSELSKFDLDKPL